MKILILAHPRSGSTTLSRWLSQEMNFHLVLEPFNPRTPMKIPNTEDYVMKELYHHLVDKNIDIENFINQFDYVIGLYRKNMKDTLISIFHADKTKKYHTSYTINDEELKKYEKEIGEENNFFVEYHENIKKFSHIHVSYENIFDNKDDIEKIKNFLKIEELNFLWMLDNRNRYRKNYEKII